MARHGQPQPDDPDSGGSSDEGDSARFRDTALASTLVDVAALDAAEIAVQGALGRHCEPSRWDQAVADVLVERGTLTRFQATQMLAGRRKLTLGQYRILDVLGQGGMGQVFKAEHAMMGRSVAVKVLPRAKSTPDTEAAFRREIRMLGRLDHPNLVHALDAGHDGKVYYLVTELIEGVDLRKQVLKYGTLDEASASSVISQVARGLAYVHREGLVHRDVKPGNILVTPAGHAKLLDVGLAGSVLESESTRLGRVVGTMDYMAPEQIRSPDTVGPAADVYGLGCTLYFVLAGQVPFPGGTRQEKARRQLTEAPEPIQKFAPGISPAFCRVVEAMMDKDPVQRIGTPAAVIEWLRPWTPDEPVPMERRPRSRSRGSSASASAPVPTRSSDAFDASRFDQAFPGSGPSDGSSGFPSGMHSPLRRGSSQRRSGAGAVDSRSVRSGDGGPSSWEWPSPPPLPPRRQSVISMVRGLVGEGDDRLPRSFALGVAAGLMAAAVVQGILLVSPGFAGGMMQRLGPTTVAIAVAVGVTVVLLRMGGVNTDGGE